MRTLKSEVVKHTAQTLTNAQKAQARTNIGAITVSEAPVQSVNSKTGAVNLTASDVGALPASTAIPSKTSDLVNDSHYITAAEAPVQSVNGQSGDVTISMPSIDSVVTPGGTNPVNSVAIIAYINSLDADDTEY